MSDAPDKDNPPTGSLMFHLHTYLEDQEVDLYNIDYTLQFLLQGQTETIECSSNNIN
jgi:hypothetical protein